MSTTSTEGGSPAEQKGTDESPRTKLVESIFDSLPLWTVLAAAISFLYLVWVTLDVVGRYLGGIPKVGP